MYLSDGDIQRRLPGLFLNWQDIHQEQVQPASIDLRLASTMYRIGPGEHELTEHEARMSSYYLVPGVFYLAATIEVLMMPDDLLARVDGRSSWGRAGLRVHSTAGFIDPGFRGSITLEIDVIRPVQVPEGTRICQVSFARLLSPAERPYGRDRGSNYLNQPSGVPVPGRYGPHLKEKPKS
jgi:dCTP deaminase